MENLYQNTAQLYDLDNRDILRADIPFYLGYAEKYPGEILELGCGTGRVALSLAEHGYNVTGLDLSNQMLEIFQQKLKKTPYLTDKLTLVYGNMADFTINKAFSLIIAPFRAFQSLTDERDIENALHCIREHLAEDGVFIINVFNPHPVMDESWCYDETVQWERFDELTGNYIVKKHWGHKIDTLNQIIFPRFAFEIIFPNGEMKRVTDNLTLKYYYSNQLREVVEKNGFRVEDEFSWYDKSPPCGREIILICRRKNYDY